MSDRRKSQRLKKRDEYDREHRTAMENPHAFRTNWPKKKARANRRERVKIRALLARLPADDLTAGAVAAAVKRHDIHKSGVMTVREMLQQKARKRASRAGSQAEAPASSGVQR